jgi:hypothetical protein
MQKDLVGKALVSEDWREIIFGAAIPRAGARESMGFWLKR